MTDAQTDDLSRLAREIVRISIDAGREVLKYYGSRYRVERKHDGSRVTQADFAAHHLIESALEAVRPTLPVISEESNRIPAFAERSKWSRYWLVDPIDGTNGFIGKTGEFTVNIALIEGAKSILGVIHQPVVNHTYWAARGLGAFRTAGECESQPISVRKFVSGAAMIVGNRSRGRERRDMFVSALSTQDIRCDVRRLSSSLKFCRVAEGSADLYPAFGHTHEWDTAAGQCIVECAGGKVVDMQGGEVLQYNKPDMLNPWFIASGGGDYPWERFA